MLEYFLCIKDCNIYPNVDESLSNQFVNQVFFNHSLTASSNLQYDTSNFVLTTPIILKKGNIYRNFDYNPKMILSDNYVAIEIEKVKDYLVKYDLKIDDNVQDIIKNKPNDKIEIQPLSINEEDKSVSYSCGVTTKRQNGLRVSYTATANTQYAAVKNCYNYLRTQTSLFYALREWARWGKTTIRHNWRKTVK